MGKIFVDRREGERRIGERRDFSPAGLAMQSRWLETMPERRKNGDRRDKSRRQNNETI
ncbi:MAG: hypothetical protein ABH878_06455 [bacterium]